MYVFKNFEGNPRRESPEMTISASGGLELLQIVLEQDTDIMPLRTLGSQGGVDLSIIHVLKLWGKCIRVLKPWRPTRQSTKRTISASSGL